MTDKIRTSITIKKEEDIRMGFSIASGTIKKDNFSISITGRTEILFCFGLSSDNFEVYKFDLKNALIKTREMWKENNKKQRKIKNDHCRY